MRRVNSACETRHNVANRVPGRARPELVNFFPSDRFPPAMTGEERPTSDHGVSGTTGPAKSHVGPSPAEFAGIGIQFAASIVLCLFAGQWLDRRLGSAPLFTLAGVFLGAGASFYSMYRKLTKKRPNGVGTKRP